MGTITRRIYKNTEEHFSISALMTPSKDVTFKLDGHNWRWSHSSFDDEGDYLVIYRFDEDGPDIAAEDMNLFHALLCNAVSGLCANPSFYEDMEEEKGRQQIPEVLAISAFDVAMEAYNLVRSKL